MSTFRKSVPKIEFPLKSDKNYGYFTGIIIHILRYYLSRFFLGWEIVETNVIEKSKHTFCIQYLFFRKFRRVWDKVQKYGTADVTTDGSKIRCMRFVCWITGGYRQTLRIYNSYAFPQQQWLHELAWMLRYTYIMRVLYSFIADLINTLKATLKCWVLLPVYAASRAVKTEEQEVRKLPEVIQILFQIIYF